MTLFTNAELGNVRVLEIDGEPYFVGKDVAVALGYKDSSDAIKKHVDNEDKLSRRFADSGQNREMYIINESGLYSLILSSKLPKAKEFKRWITAEVLPIIRKTGGYVNDTKQFVDYYFADCNTYGREAIALKLKLAYYNLWKYLRGVSYKVLKRGHLDGKETSSLTTPLMNQYYAWLKRIYAETEDKESIPRDICSLRKLFYASDEGRNFTKEGNDND